MDTEYGAWSESIERMVSGWEAPATPEFTAELFADIHVLIDLHMRRDPAVEQSCRDYVDRAQAMGAFAWAAAGRAVWAMTLWDSGNEDSSLLQLVLAELDLQKAITAKVPDAAGGPTGPGAASNNLGVVHTLIRAYELGVPHFRRAVAESDAKYGPQLWLQRLIDHANLAESLLRFALHNESVGNSTQAKALAVEAGVSAERFLLLARTYERKDAEAFAAALRIGADSVVSPGDVDLPQAERMLTICENQVFGDEASEAIVWSIRARVCRLVGDEQGCLDAVSATRRTARAGDHSVVAVAARESALLTPAQGPVWEYATTISDHAESNRRRAVAALQTRLKLAGLEQRFEQMNAERSALQSQLEQALKAEAQLIHAATHDALTGLPNRSLFSDRLDSLWQRVRSGTTDLAIGYIDLDDLKAINDSEGHSAGDAALVAVANRLRANVNSIDTVARLSGDEFAVLLLAPGGLADLQRWADSINQALRAQGISVSVGVCLVRAASETEPEKAMACADEQMYAAKRGGKGRAQVSALPD